MQKKKLPWEVRQNFHNVLKKKFLSEISVEGLHFDRLQYWTCKLESNEANFFELGDSRK